MRFEKYYITDKKDWYHIVNIENNVLYDSEDDSLELYVISIYKKN